MAHICLIVFVSQQYFSLVSKNNEFSHKNTAKVLGHIVLPFLLPHLIRTIHLMRDLMMCNWTGEAGAHLLATILYWQVPFLIQCVLFYMEQTTGLE